MNQQEKSHDIFTDPALAGAGSDDPVAKFIADNWRYLLVVGVLVFGSYYIYTRYQATQVASQTAAADLFVKVQESLRELTGLEAQLTQFEAKLKEKGASGETAEESKERTELSAKVTQAKEKFGQRLAALSDARDPYGHFSGLYRALNGIRSGDVAAVRTALSPVTGELSAVNNAQGQFIAELSELMLARALLDEPSTYNEARTKLKDLASKGNYVHAASAFTLARVSITSEERQEARDVLNSVVAAHPEQSDLLSEEIVRLKSS